MLAPAQTHTHTHFLGVTAKGHREVTCCCSAAGFTSWSVALTEPVLTHGSCQLLIDLDQYPVRTWFMEPAWLVMRIVDLINMTPVVRGEAFNPNWIRCCCSGSAREGLRLAFYDDYQHLICYFRGVTVDDAWLQSKIASIGIRSNKSMLAGSKYSEY